MSEDLAKRIAAAFRDHYLSADRTEADADGNAPCVCGDWREPGPMGGDDEGWDHHLAEVALAAVQGAYVPPPPGSDRDALPEHLRVLIAPYMPPYTSTACQTVDALEAAAVEHPGMAGELREWAERQREACRITRKQDMAACQHPQHQEPALDDGSAP